MLICGSYKFEFSVSKDMKNIYNKGCGSREGSDTIMSNTNYQRMQRIEN
jgi:hypothetical protein